MSSPSTAGTSQEPATKVDSATSDARSGHLWNSETHATERHPEYDSAFPTHDEELYDEDPTAAEVQKFKLVQFEPEDRENPMNWSSAYKWYVSLSVAILCFGVALASAIVTGDISGPAEEFGVSEEVVIVTITVFVLGFGFGPLVFSPLSEMFGRRPIYIITFGIGTILNIGCALTPNIGGLIAIRAVDGLALSAPMTLVGGTLSDMWAIRERGKAMAVFSLMPFLGPSMGPLIGGWICTGVKDENTSRYGYAWRWIYWVLFIFLFVCWILISTVPETLAPVLLTRRAKRLRAETGDDSYRSHYELHKKSLGENLRISLSRPIILLVREPIVALISLYMSVIYGCLYMFFFAYPYVYMTLKGYSEGITGLMFLPIVLGTLIATFMAPFINNHYIRLSEQYNGRPPAEMRLIPMMYGCWLVPIGLFSFAWTTYPSLSWAGPAFSAIPCGTGFLLLYNSANNYLVDCYQHYAASALAAKTFVRSIWGACVVLFTLQMYARLNAQWATSLIAFICLACCAIPYLFYFKGAAIRKFSKYAYSPEAEENGEKTTQV